jgi:hypothetical protein
MIGASPAHRTAAWTNLPVIVGKEFLRRDFTQTV